MKKVPVEAAIGMIVAHDMTKIVPGKFKGVGFKRGHVIRSCDISALYEIGKHHVYVLEPTENEVHEDDAACRIAAAISDDSITWSAPEEGKTEIKARFDGLLKIDLEGLKRINKMGDVIVSTLKSWTPCKAGQIVAATRIIPLLIPKDKIEQLEYLTGQNGPVVRVLPYRKMTFGAVVTGSEIYEGRIDDGFERHVGCKLSSYGCEFLKKIVMPDDAKMIADALLELRDLGCDLIVITGGLSVDPDDVTRVAVHRAGAEIITYGSPVLPGAMFLYARLGNVAVLGLPACVFYFKTTIFDIVLPRVLAGEPINQDIIAELGHGGLCLNCSPCRFPACYFGR